MNAILFDLDNTLYPAERDLFSLIDVRINRYMVELTYKGKAYTLRM